jgi:hypothetical protein
MVIFLSREFFFRIGRLYIYIDGSPSMGIFRIKYGTRCFKNSGQRRVQEARFSAATVQIR